MEGTDKGDCDHDLGGYFLIKGAEKVSWIHDVHLVLFTIVYANNSWGEMQFFEVSTFLFDEEKQFHINFCINAYWDGLKKISKRLP